MSRNADSILFTPIKIGPVTAMNRFMRSATFLNGADKKGIPQKWLLDQYIEMGHAKTGIINSGHVYVTHAGKASPGQGGLENQSQAEAWAPAIKEIKKNGSLFYFQLSDAGAMAFPFIDGFKLNRGPSWSFPISRKMSEKEIDNEIKYFGRAARLAADAGADGVQLHGAHGYLISQFLSKNKNKRDDFYGDGVAFAQAIVDEVRRQTPNNFSVTMKINGSDFTKHGNTVEDTINIIKRLKDVDMFEISSGLLSAFRNPSGLLSFKKFPYSEGYHAPMAKAIKEKTGRTIALVGGNRKFRAMERAVKSGVADVVSMSRPFIQNPSIVADFESGKLSSRCINCGKCMIAAFTSHGHCVGNPRKL